MEHKSSNVTKLYYVLGLGTKDKDDPAPTFHRGR